MWPEPWGSFNRFRFRRVLAGLVAGLIGTTPAAAAEEWRTLTLDQALGLAEQAPLAQSAALEVEAARAATQEAGLWPNPDFAFEREAAGEEVERVVAVSIPLPLSGYLGLERSAAGAALAAARASARQARIERWYLVCGAFLDLVSAQERDKVLKAALVRLDDLSRTIRAREAAGESSSYDRMRSDLEHAELLSQRLEARGALEGARAALASRLGLSASPPIVAEGTLETEIDLPDAVIGSVAALGRGDVEALAAESERQDLLAQATARRAFPRPVLLLGRKTQCVFGVCDSGVAVGVSVTLPIFDRRQGQRAAFQVQAALARAQREALAQEAQAQIDSALAETRALRKAEAALVEAPSSDRLLVVARAAYEAGEMRVFELLDAYQSALAQSLRRVDSHLAARRAELRLHRAIGVESTP